MPLVWRTMRRLGVQERDLEDQAHEVFLIVHRKLAEYDPSRPFRTWLIGICHRRAADYRRLTRHKVETFGDGHEAPASNRTLEDHYAERESWDLLCRALDELDEERRVAVVLHDLEGLPLAEIARMTDTPLQTVYSRVRAGRASLEARLRRATEDEER